MAELAGQTTQLPPLSPCPECLAAQRRRRGSYLRNKERTRLGDVLLRQGLVTQDDVRSALAHQAQTGQKLGEVLRSREIVSHEHLQHVLRDQEEQRKGHESRLIHEAGRSLCAWLTAETAPVLAERGMFPTRILRETRLGRLLWHAGILTNEHLERAIERQRKTGRKLGELLRRLGHVSAAAIRAALRVQKRLRRLLVGVAACGVLALAAGCNNYDYRGTAVPATPWDVHWQRVTDAMEQASHVRPVREEGTEYWQTPQETARLGTGDCEDISIYLFAELTKSGVGDVRVCVGKRKPADRSLHAWVVWFTPEGTYILDPSFSKGVEKARSFPRGFYKPLYSYDAKNKYVHMET